MVQSNEEGRRERKWERVEKRDQNGCKNSDHVDMSRGPEGTGGGGAGGGRKERTWKKEDKGTTCWKMKYKRPDWDIFDIPREDKFWVEGH